MDSQEIGFVIAICLFATFIILVASSLYGSIVQDIHNTTEYREKCNVLEKTATLYHNLTGEEKEFVYDHCWHSILEANDR